MAHTPNPKNKTVRLQDMIRDEKSPSGKSLDLQQIQKLLSGNSEDKSVEEFLKEFSSEKEIRPVRNPSQGVSVFTSEKSEKIQSKRPTPLKVSGGETQTKDNNSISRNKKRKVVNLWKK